jgi:hypothetical protein
MRQTAPATMAGSARRRSPTVDVRITVWPTTTSKGEAARLRFMKMKKLDVIPSAAEMLATIPQLNAERVAAG